MKENKRVILHITFDGIIFDQVYKRFEEMDGYENRYLLHNYGVDKKFRFIKNYDKIIIADSFTSWSNIVGDPSVDIIYLHGLWYSYFKAFDYIRPNVIVIWWCYGMEIYENSLRWPPLLPLKLYKPKSYRFYLKNMMSMHLLAKEISRISPGLFVFLLKSYNFIRGKRINELEFVLSRINFLFTPLELEYEELKKRHSFIKAQPFRLKPNVEKETVQEHHSAGGILLEHSANLTNNHLDIIAAIKNKRIDLKNRDIIVPLNYGEKRLAQRVRKEANFDGANVNCLIDPVPFKDYCEIISGCTHAIFGMIRQSGLGNIYMCFRKGIKIFFFIDSILYKHFKSQGYYVFTIENDLNDSSIKEPFTLDQAKFNSMKYYSQCVSQSTYEQQFDVLLNDYFINN